MYNGKEVHHEKMEKYAITLLAQDHPGVMQRLSGLIARRGFNIDSITAGDCEARGLKRLTLIASVEGEEMLHQIINQMKKIPDILVIHLHDKDAIRREMAFVKIKAEPDDRMEIIKLIEHFKGYILDIDNSKIIVELTGKPEKINAFMKLMEPFGIIEASRTGVMVMERNGSAGNKA